MATTKKNYAKVKVWGERVTWSGEGPLMGVIVQMFSSVPADNHEYLLKKLKDLSDDMRGGIPQEPVGQAAIDIAVRFGGIDGAHHKAWVIDQMVRALAGDRYAKIVADAKAGEHGPDTYGWDEGVAP